MHGQGNWMGKAVICLVVGLVVMASGWRCEIEPAMAAASEKSVVEEILDILKANGQINQQQYEALLAKARAEERARALRKAATPQAQPAAEKAGKRPPANKAKGTELHVYWNKGLSFQSEDKAFAIGIGGRIMTDWGYLDADRDVEKYFSDSFGSGAEIRRARIKLSGTLYRDIGFKSEIGFAGGKVALKDMYLQMKHLPYVGSLVIGHAKEPFSLEELTSSNSSTFMERSLPVAFVPGRNIGFMLHNSAFDRKMTWAVGVFRETNDTGDGFDDSDHYNVTGRVTAVPWRDQAHQRFVHLGLSYSHQFMDDDTGIRFRQRPESHLTDERFVDTGEIPADALDLFGSEAALVLGPFSVQGEYIHSWVSATGEDDPDFGGFYVYASYILTGEQRNYDSAKGVFKGVKPRNNFSLRDHGWGAWEVALRYSRLDLDSSDIDGGTLDDMTVGLNWYLNPNTRFMLNYVLADLDGVGDTNIIESRLQLNF